MSSPTLFAAVGLACLASTLLLLRRTPPRPLSILDLDTVYA